MTTVNIVMLTKNRNRLFAQAIRTLYANTPIGMFNLTLVDDGSDVPMTMATESSCTLRIEGSRGITGQARNLGIYWSERYWGRGDYLYLSDSDIVFLPGWLETLIEAKEKSGVELIGGWNHPFLKPNSPYRFNVATHDAVAGASQLMRWETWDKYSPLDAHAVGLGQSEDYAFCQKIIKDGGRVGSIYPRVCLNTGITNSLGAASIGADVMHEELVEAKKTYSDLHWE